MLKLLFLISNCPDGHWITALDVDDNYSQYITRKGNNPYEAVGNVMFELMMNMEKPFKVVGFVMLDP